MTVGYKKITEMIAQEVDSVESLSDDQKSKLKQLCNKIYMLEASSESLSSARMKETIKSEISLFADRMRDPGGGE